MRISDWSSDVCSSDLGPVIVRIHVVHGNQRRTGDANREHIREFKHRANRGETSVGTAGDADTISIEPGMALAELAYRRDVIIHADELEPALTRRCECAAARRGAARLKRNH